MKKHQLNARVTTTIAPTKKKRKTENGKATYSWPKQSLTRDSDTLNKELSKLSWFSIGNGSMKKRAKQNRFELFIQ